MNLKEIAAIAEKPGLFRILRPSQKGVIVETIDDKKQRSIAAATSKVSLLSEITMYTTTAEGSIPLAEVMSIAYAKFPNGNELSSKSSSEALHGFMADIVPDYDRERVYTSDLKKLVTWFNLLVKFAPDVFQASNEDASIEDTSSTEAPEELTEVLAEEKPKPAKKSTKKKEA